MPDRIDVAADELWRAVMEHLGDSIPFPARGERPHVELKTVSIKPFSNADLEDARNSEEAYHGLHIHANASIDIRRKI